MTTLHKSPVKICLITVLVLLSSTVLKAQRLNLIPYPKQVKVLKGDCTVENSPIYTRNKRLSGLLKYFNEELFDKTTIVSTTKQLIELKIIPLSGVHGSYSLTTYQKHVGITAMDSTGIFNGLITLMQLYKSTKVVNGKLTLPHLVIHDQPRFGWRGFMLDESRHFFGKDKVKQLLNWMAFYKLNRFHWHLTDSHGWRLEIKKYPLLTTIGGRGNFTDSLAVAAYYTQAEIREIVHYAKERFITIIPEIDMPGHATAANHAYSAFSGGSAPGYDDFTFNPGKEETYTFISNILKEVKSMFPSGRIHIGGDEVALGIAAWKNNPDVIKLMAAEKLTDLNQVEHYFLRRVGDSVIKQGDNLICWDEAVSADLPVKNTYVDWWRQNKPESLSEAISKGYKVILCPRLPMYFDFVQDSTHRSGRRWDGQFNTYLDLYHFPETLAQGSIAGKNNVIGLQANLWTETVISPKRLDYLVFPRMAALAEAGWTNASLKSDNDFNTRLKAHLSLYDQKDIYYYNPFQPGLHPEPVDVTSKEND